MTLFEWYIYIYLIDSWGYDTNRSFANHLRFSFGESILQTSINEKHSKSWDFHSANRSAQFSNEWTAY